jgi:hypothetical protein
MIRSWALLLLTAVLAAGTVLAQPDKTASLDKAKEKFEKEMAKADETLVSGMDKAILQATKSGNKKLQERLSYERPLFITQHFIPTAFPIRPNSGHWSKSSNWHTPSSYHPESPAQTGF